MTKTKKAGAETARQAYEKLKANKEALSRLGEFKDLVLAAPSDGVSDAELIQILKKELPAIKITVKKLKELRDKWAADDDGVGDGSASEPEGDE